MIRYAFIIVCFIAICAVLSGQIDSNIITLTPPETQAVLPAVEVTPWSTHAKNIVQVLFWITIGTISILTYCSAKKTILQPIRTEIFKVQLEEMRRILSMFVGKDELELREAYAFDKLLLANTTLMFDSYAATFFDIKVDRDKRPYCNSECPSSMITQEGMMKYFELADDHIQKQPIDSHKEEKDPRVRAALWADYEQYEMRIPREFLAQESKIKDLLENPLLPSECVKLLTEYRDVIHENLYRTRNILTACAKEMPDKYTSVESLKRSSLDWIRHRFADEFVHLKPKAEAVIKFVRSCYDVDNLLKS